jgi:hypothetical protein
MEEKGEPTMSAFMKQRHCPSSELLAALATSKPFSYLLRESVSRHLRACDFCSAEWSFLKKTPLCDEDLVEIEVPLALRLVAENLLPILHMTEIEQERAA